jgi:hypothetical protein
MSSSALKGAPPVNLDEFERRLRVAGARVGPQEDPLDELARLVGAEARGPRPFDRAAAPPAPAPQLHLPHIDESANEGNDFDHLLHADFNNGEPAQADRQSAQPAHEEASAHDDAAPLEAAHSDAYYHSATLAPAEEPMAAPRRSGRTTLTLSVLIAVGAAGLVAAWALKGAPGLPRNPPVIMAADGPTKVAPPSQETVASPGDSASMLPRDPSAKPGPVNLVSTEEQPVDLQLQTRSLSAPSSAAPANPPATAPSSATAPPPSGTTPPAPPLTTLGPAMAAPAAPAPFPEPKRVKTVSVRPDGSVISSGSGLPAAADAAAAAPAAPADAAAAIPAPTDGAPQPVHPPVPVARPSFDAAASGAPQPTTPKLDLPAKPTAKSTARVPTAKIDTTASPEAPLRTLPTKLEKPVKASPPPTEVASNEPAAPAATAVTSSGAYSVQIAAPGSEEEAKSAAARLQSKYSSELGGLQPAIRPAEVNGRSIYRVRVGGLSKADAVALCLKLKASGGDAACFVAKN